jgi:hypothetical protein
MTGLSFGKTRKPKSLPVALIMRTCPGATAAGSGRLGIGAGAAAGIGGGAAAAGALSVHFAVAMAAAIGKIKRRITCARVFI